MGNKAELVTKQEHVRSDGEIVPVVDRSIAAASMAAVTESRTMLGMAKEFPRNEFDAFQKIISSCRRPSFAEGVSYVFPRGGKPIAGPSVKLAREMARVWGNIQYGLEVIKDTETDRHIRAWAWDMETNAKVFSEDSFKKLIQRKDYETKETRWVEPDERDLRELMNRRGAILIRNCILQLMPPDYVDDAVLTAQETITNRAAKDPDGERKRIAASFVDLGVPVSEIEEWAGVKFAQLTPKHITDLRSIYASIRDGNSRWSDYMKTKPKEDDGRSATEKAKEQLKKRQQQRQQQEGEQDTQKESAPQESTQHETRTTKKEEKAASFGGSLDNLCPKVKDAISAGILKPHEIQRLAKLTAEEQTEELERILESDG
jgi:hypothetical protein